MANRKPKRITPDEFYRAAVGSAPKAGSLAALLLRFILWRQERNYSEKGIFSHARHIYHFIEWCHIRGLAFPQEITRPIMERYQSALHQQHYKNNQDKPLSVRTQHHRLTAIKTWFTWMSKQSLILANPAVDLEMPKLMTQLPRYILSVNEIEHILRLPDLSTPQGIRDRALLEVLWSTGIRRSELANLDICSVNRERSLLTIRQGKGRRDRVVPIGERALTWLVHYLDEVRPQKVINPKLKALFLSSDGMGGLVSESIGYLVRMYIRDSGLPTSGSCHLFRHAMATQMLENGADTRWIQAMLGHQRLETTQIYTQVSIRALQAVHAATHPAQRERQRLCDTDIAGE